MKRRLTTLVLLLAASASAVPLDTAKDSKLVSVSISHLETSAKERVVLFEVDLTSAMVKSVSNVPKGWYVVVDNDASWRTKVTGNVLVGAAAVSPEELKQLRLVVEKDESLSKFAVTGSVSVTENFEETRNVQLRNSDFAVSSTK
jgi:ABC-type amino acid transport substrate-binding protein